VPLAGPALRALLEPGERARSAGSVHCWDLATGHHLHRRASRQQRHRARGRRGSPLAV